jgi:hypothetical protein
MMGSERPPDDLKAIWQNQPTENSAMTLKLIQSKARELHARTRRRLLGTVAGPLAAAFLYGFARVEFPSLAYRLHALFALALAWSIAGLYFLNRGMWPGVAPGDGGLSTGLEYCRDEIARRRSLLQRLLLWSLAPVLLALGTFIFALAIVGTRDRALFPNGLPFLVLVAVWIAGYFAMRVREQHELKREMDALSDLERNNNR